MKKRCIQFSSCAILGVLVCTSLAAVGKIPDATTAAEKKTAPAQCTESQSVIPNDSQPTGTVPAVPDYWSLARQAFESGELDLSEHYCLSLIHSNTATGNAVDLLLKVRMERVTHATKDLALDDYRELRAFTYAQSRLDDTQTLIDNIAGNDIKSRSLTESDRSQIYASSRTPRF